jgi:energy-converting hydrogenase Eha subunit A
VASPAVLFLHAVVFASASMLVVWSVGLTLDTNGPMKNYYAVIPSLGVALGLAALAHQWLGRSRVARVALAGVIGLNGAVHFQTNLYFAKEWEVQRSVWDQVRARCPDIEQGTTLCLSWPEFPRFTVESQHLSWVANLLYADPDSARLNFQALPLTPSHWGWPNESQPEVVLRPGASFKVWARTRSFVSNGKTLVFYYDKISDVVYCLDRDLPILPRSAPFAVRFWAERSDTSVIRMRRCSKDWTTELRIWKPRSGGWGDYFQRIQLLRQQEDWEGVLALAQEARVRNLVPINTVDLLPELDACLHLDQKSQALRLYETVARSGPYETALLRRLLELRKDRSPLAKDLLDCHGPPILR